MSTTFVCKEATTRAEVDAITEVIWAAHYSPYQPFFSAYNPIFGPTSGDRESAIAASKERFWKMHVGTPGSHWVMIIDPETEKVVAGGEWTFNTSNPFPGGYEPDKIVAEQWPEGTVGRDFVSEMFKQLYKPRQTWMQRPVACKPNSS